MPRMLRPPCRALLIDLDGVLRRFDPAHGARVEVAHGLPAGLLAASAFAPERLRPAITGRVSHAAWMAGVAEAVAAVTGDPRSAQAAVAEWRANRGAVVPEALAAVREVRAAGVPVALATNATDILDTDLDLLGLASEVDVVVNSSTVGHAKPSPDFFAVCCESVGVEARQCLFVDDDDRNVRGARAAGLAAFRYTSPEDLRYLRPALAPGGGSLRSR
jgi:putative hydrolase of the HAD superfamily